LKSVSIEKMLSNGAVMTVIRKKFDKDFFKKIDGKIIKKIEIRNGEKLKDVRAAVSAEEDESVSIAILPGDLKIPGLIRVLQPDDILEVELFDSKKEMLEVLVNFGLRPPSSLLESLIDDFSSIKRRSKFDNELVEYIDPDAVSCLSAALWMIDDPNLEKRFAQPEDVKT